MPRKALGPRLYFDDARQSYVIRHGRKFIRTGASGWRDAHKKLAEYLDTHEPPDRPDVAQPTKGFVYFITADHDEWPVKIGFTEKLNSVRISGLQTGSPRKLVMLASLPGTYQDERFLHRKFAAHRLTGEWFSRTPELMALIADCPRGDAGVSP